MESPQQSFKSIAYTYGVYYALLGIAMIVSLYIMETDSNIILTIVNVLGTVGIIAYSVIAYKKENGNAITLSQSMKAGLATAAIGGLLIALFTYIHYSFINPEFITTIRENALEDIYKSGTEMTADAEEQALSLMNIFTSPGFISTISLIGSIFFGLVVSLITGLIVKNA
ncbi:DUF4199 domain-containing protein [Bizionia gelidisalsuginis]|uniref:DUF4199 domain-containing protein n=2 Tax=Bizionia TaxID=283785 RepID=A0A8H2LIK6_9FLAO|nr:MULTISPECIES: DUF4199 domain-containing protein [Bizionia]TYB77432.1 DUF4199 domain-containing protein [Bizionia saleffrena]TYC17887.1 DUF4199 domain-containing protein [Bizionia gelidisalsuginis]